MGSMLGLPNVASSHKGHVAGKHDGAQQVTRKAQIHCYYAITGRRGQLDRSPVYMAAKLLASQHFPVAAAFLLHQTWSVEPIEVPFRFP